MIPRSRTDEWEDGRNSDPPSGPALIQGKDIKRTRNRKNEAQLATKTKLERLRALRRRPVLKSAAGAGWFDLSCRTTGAKGEGGLSRGEVSPGVFSLTVLMFLKLLIVLTEVISAEGRLRRFQVQSKAQPQCICNG